MRWRAAMLDYPKRGPYFAHKTFRLMHKSMIAAELGRDVLCLLAVILHTEDAARYRGPVSYFNSQLIETLGFKKWEQFDAARKKAIEAGWLQYEGCGKRSAGRYFVTIPAGYEQIDDGLMEECISPENGYKQGYDAGYKAGYDEGIKRGTIQGQCGVRSGDKQGEPPISLSLPLNPTPNPKQEPPLSPKGETVVEKPKRKRGVPNYDATAYRFSGHLGTPEVHETWLSFVEMRTGKGKKHWLTKTACEIIEKDFKDYSSADLSAALRKSIVSNWDGVFPPPKSTKSSKPDLPPITDREMTFDEFIARF
jgi:hypothetical protein